jgi:hypothetical protein
MREKCQAQPTTESVRELIRIALWDKQRLPPNRFML